MVDKINYKLIDSMNVFDCEDAACLWCGVNPDTMYGELPLAVKSMLLTFRERIGNHINFRGVTRRELLELADNMDYEPAFLFVENRIIESEEDVTEI